MKLVNLIDAYLNKTSKKPAKKQELILNKFGMYKIIKRHDDGDLTLEYKNSLYVLDTNGKIFKEIIGPTELKNYRIRR